MKTTYLVVFSLFHFALSGASTAAPPTSDSTGKYSLGIYQSIYGQYDSNNCCWQTGPQAPAMEVGHYCQTQDVRNEIEYKLSKYPAVEQAVKMSAMNCNSNQWIPEGLSDSCPSKYLRATVVNMWGIRWYIVRPNMQCLTYKECSSQGNCANTYGSVEETNLSAGGERKRRSGGGKSDACAPGSESTCLPDGYRTFQVWIYCRQYGFRLINLRLPQCCACKRYNTCSTYK